MIFTRNRSERRQLRWVSSLLKNNGALEALERQMAAFYSDQVTRPQYQSMIDAESSAQPLTEAVLRAEIVARRPQSVLEVGCGSGRIYCRLRAEGLKAAYTGLEMSPEVLAQNTVKYPEARWVSGSVYGAPFAPKSFDVVFAYFVLEHCVYPARALEKVVGLLRPGGVALLVFPDFVEMGRFGSQALGFVEGRASERLRRGDVLNALFNLYESRIRLPRALRVAVKQFGPFPVNLQPRCLTNPEVIVPDVDAVYVSSKREVQAWAESRGLGVSYPAGTEGNFRHNVLIELSQP